MSEKESIGENTPNIREKHIIGLRARERRIAYWDCVSFRQYGIELIGVSDVTGDFAFARHHPHFLQILVCASGHGVVWVDNQWVRCSAGMALITPAKKFHAYYALDDQQWSVGWILYPEPDTGVPIHKIERPELRHIDPQPFMTAVRGLCREFSGRAESQALALWCHLAHVYAQRILNPVVIDRRLEQLWEEVASHLSHTWTINELAQRAEMSREHLRRLCQAQFQCSPLRYVTRMRMREAAAMLVSTPLSVSEIAHYVGYENQFAFSVAFKRETQLSPIEYRTRARG